MNSRFRRYIFQLNKLIPIIKPTHSLSRYILVGFSQQLFSKRDAFKLKKHTKLDIFAHLVGFCLFSTYKLPSKTYYNIAQINSSMFLTQKPRNPTHITASSYLTSSLSVSAELTLSMKLSAL